MEHRIYPRYRYVIATIIFADFPLELAVRYHEWLSVVVIALVLLFLAVHRLIDIGWQRRWAVPLCCIGMSPALVLYSRPGVSLRLILGCMAVLQVPIMAWPEKQTGTTLPTASAVG
jgi:hypothetical protein